MLIDADNASANSIEFILKKVDTFGHIGCKKIYGDWGNTYLQRWQEALLKYAIHPIQLFSYAKGKNATDIGMVIDTMDLLHSGDYDGFCLVSSDSDFTSLALRIRHSHIKVIGFGKKNTVTAFVQACDNFYYVENLLPPIPVSAALPQLAPKPVEAITPKVMPQKVDNKIVPIKAQTAVSAPKTIQPIIDNTSANSTKPIVKKWEEQQLKCDTRLLNSLRTSITNHPQADTQNWVSYSCVDNAMKKHYPNFEPNKYGHPTLASIIKSINLFETKVISSLLFIREKNSKNVPPKSIPSPSVTDTPMPWTTQQLQTQTHLISVLNKLIKEDPKSKKGWSNISHIASQIKQSHTNIKLKEYGYPKFSDLVKALAVHEVRLENSSVFIKIKMPKASGITATPIKNNPEQLLVKDALPNNPSSKPSNNALDKSSNSLPTNKPITTNNKIAHNNALKQLPSSQTSFAIYSSSTTDVILFCMNTQHDTHLVEDTIYTHQKNSKDGAIILRQQLSNGITKSNFACALHQQAATIDQLVFIIVIQHNDLSADKACPTIEIDIRSWVTGISFSETFKVPTEKGKSLLLFSVNKVDNEWQFMPQNILVSGDFQNLCKEHGITLNND